MDRTIGKPNDHSVSLQKDLIRIQYKKMKNMKFFNSVSIPALLASLIYPATLDAATISVNMIGLLDVQGTTNGTVSVFEGNSFLQASSDGTLSPSTIPLVNVLDYAFYSTSSTPYAAGSSAGIGTLTSTGGFNATATRQPTNVYTTNDPGAPSPTPNFTNAMLTFTTTNSVGNATLDLAALGASSANPLDIYVILGGFSNNWRVRATDTTTNDTGVVQIARGNFPNSPQFVFHISVTDFDTANDLLLAFDGGFNNPTIQGIIVSQIPEPSALGLVALSGLAFVRRRR